MTHIEPFIRQNAQLGLIVKPGNSVFYSAGTHALDDVVPVDSVFAGMTCKQCEHVNIDAEQPL